MEEKKVENALLRREDFRTILEMAEAKPNQALGATTKASIPASNTAPRPAWVLLMAHISSCQTKPCLPLTR